jgi:teichoic acid glycerol-phosphate primase
LEGVLALQLEKREEIHFIDHLVPLCFFLDIPLYLNCDVSASKFSKIYPGVNFQTLSKRYGDITPLLEKNDAFLYAHFHRPQMEKMLIDLGIDPSSKRFIYLPHGNSEKGKKSLWMENYVLEDITLLYGKRMENFLKEKDLYEMLRYPLRMGNLRKKYYEKQEAFYKGCLKGILPKFRHKKTLLYAPTWMDWEGSSSLNSIFSILDSLRDKWNILIKLHPRVYDDQKAAIMKLESCIKEPVYLLEDTPLVYPLINLVDAYLGDASSVAYDFLSVDKPLYFLEGEDPLYIHQAGRVIKKESISKTLQVIDEHYIQDISYYQKIRKRIYEETFDQSISLETFKKDLDFLLKNTKKEPIMKTYSKFAKHLSKVGVPCL